MFRFTYVFKMESFTSKTEYGILSNKNSEAIKIIEQIPHNELSLQFMYYARTTESELKFDFKYIDSLLPYNVDVMLGIAAYLEPIKKP